MQCIYHNVTVIYFKQKCINNICIHKITNILFNLKSKLLTKFSYINRVQLVPWLRSFYTSRIEVLYMQWIWNVFPKKMLLGTKRRPTNKNLWNSLSMISESFLIVIQFIMIFCCIRSENTASRPLIVLLQVQFSRWVIYCIQLREKFGSCLAWDEILNSYLL